METCKNCTNNISQGNLYKCPNCNATFCKECSVNTKHICPYCYSSLEING